ncbi:phage tail domain-containing protein [Streptomyces sp. JJ36]|uniref:phage distal tail protein n=1 Tax=Streptomyces sp. JJ36 TaxID=2736645 RepID=UPI001F2F0E6A|nr:phage tail domain-containing protein [Streptomyces sp. JJ36]MCF6523055.1 phage tail family protein [Streptomyces sp. JJ36]
MIDTRQLHTDQGRPGSLITRDGQIQWAGILFGPGTPYAVDAKGITGWDDLPALDSGDVPRPDQHGSWPGARWAKPRTVGATVWLLPDAPRHAHAVMQEFRAATGLHDGESWLAVRLHGETLACRARVDRRVIPQDRAYVTQGAAKASLQWIATDPRRFEAQQRQARATLPLPEQGLRWNEAGGTGQGLAWPLDWGTAGQAGTASVVNDGSAAAHPVIELRGPVQRPRLTRLTDGRRLQYDLALGAGDVLTVDTHAGTVLLNGTTSRLYTATPDSSPEQLFTLEPGTTPLVFRSDDTTPDPNASVTVRWRNAHW